MKKRKYGEVLLLSLIGGILVLSISIISCGYGPQTKVLLSDKGNYALDISRTSGNEEGGAVMISKNLPSIEDTELTVEAWIKKKDASTTLNGGIFSRFDIKGIALWVKNNTPKFAIVVKNGATSVYYTLACGVTIDTAEWVHVAGVLTKEDHSSSDAKDCDSYGKEEPHLACYIDGELKACGTTYGNPEDPATGPQYAQDDEGDSEGYHYAYIGMIPYPEYTIDKLNNNTKFEGTIDEVRLWKVARTGKEIKECMDKELSVSGSGPCIIDTHKLIGYWPLNEGSGSTTMDWAGYGAGTVMSPYNKEWTGGWVEGKVP